MRVPQISARILSLVLASLLLAALVAPQPALAAPVDNSNASAKLDSGVYIVQLLESPAVAYDGGTAGLKATRPAKGQKIDPDSADVIAYAAYLDSRHNDLLARVGGGRKLYDYHYSFNGFAAVLSARGAAALRSSPDVVAVSKDALQTMDTSSTPTFLGLTGTGGLWEKLGGVGNAGENMIIGVIDSGIWPESASFSDRTGANANGVGGKLSYQNMPTWHGKCQTTAEAWDGSNCNKKLIGARWYNAAWGGDAAVEAERPWEFMSPRDYNGHGTHTTSTAGGNNGVVTTGPAAAFGTISGMAPRARVAMYKALWSTEDASTASGFTSDLVAAIDQAVADGVDAINYSISGTTTNFLDPVEISFLFAADAGVFVAASAGNSGPTTGTVAHPSPWITTVAAGTHNRNGIGSVTLGNGTTYSGASLASRVGPAPLINSTDAGLTGADPEALRLCFTAGDNEGDAVLDPAKVTGKIVVCDRGVNARVNKSLAVKDAGGVGMILTNVTPNSLNADFHFVPTVHVADTNRAAIRAYASTTGPTATINQATLTFTDPAPFTAAFSSRGPLTAGGGDLLKPDVIAPGQDILAAVAPPGNQGLSFNLYSGTSMSSPHVAGLSVLIRQAHPDWSPMAIKSAFMTTAYDVIDGGISDATRIFRQGAGHVRPTSAADPGLVYNSSFNDWLAFLCGTTTGVSPATCNALRGAGYSTDPSNFNTAALAIGDLAGVQTLTRKVTNVGSTAANYTATVTGMSGVTVGVVPAAFTINPGETKTISINFTRTTAALNAYTGGQFTLSDGTHNVRSPIVVRPVALAAPRQVNGTGGQIDYNVTFGYTGTFSATGRGLIPATKTPGIVTDDPGDSFAPGGPGTVSFDFTVPAGTTYARFSLFNTDTDGADDLDLYVFRGATLVGASGGGTADEEVNLTNPTAATYRVWVHGFATDGPDSHFTLYTWILGSASEPNMTVSAPTTATLGATGTISLTFSGLSAATRYLGSVAYSGTTGMPNPTIVRVDTAP